MSNVILDDVVKLFGDVVAVDHVNLEIQDGEFMALVGPSGCGKTTTLNMIAGLIELTSGTISIGGKVVNDLDPKDRDIAMVFQNYALYPNKSVGENLAFPLQMRKVKKTDIEVRVKRAAEILSIGHLLNRKPRQLSGGQQQRVALGRALVRDPKAFLMDEPLSNLDAMLRVQMRSELKRLHQQLSTTVIYVTHDQMEAMTMADRIAVMSGGVLQQVGTPDDIYNRPANTFVAGFVGSPAMNFLNGTVSSTNGEAVIQGAGWQLPLTPANTARVKNSSTSEIIVGARHSNLTVLPETATNGLPSRVYTVEPTGDLTFVHVWLGDQTVIASTPGTYRGTADQPVRLEFDQDRLYLFDAESKRAL
jgi:multiple sugar transport system ATP-binding protein